MDKLVKHSIEGVVLEVFKDFNPYIKGEMEHGGMIYTNICKEGQSHRFLSLNRWRYGANFVILLLGTVKLGNVESHLIDEHTGVAEIKNILTNWKNKL